MHDPTGISAVAALAAELHELLCVPVTPGAHAPPATASDLRVHMAQARFLALGLAQAGWTMQRRTTYRRRLGRG